MLPAGTRCPASSSASVNSRSIRSKPCMRRLSQVIEHQAGKHTGTCSLFQQAPRAAALCSSRGDCCNAVSSASPGGSAAGSAVAVLRCQGGRTSDTSPVSSWPLNASLAPVTTATSTAAKVTGSIRHPHNLSPARQASIIAPKPLRPAANTRRYPGPRKRTTRHDPARCRTVRPVHEWMPRQLSAPRLRRPAAGGDEHSAVKTGWPSAPGTTAQPALTTHTRGTTSAASRPRRGRDAEQPTISRPSPVICWPGAVAAGAHPTRSRIRAASTHDPGTAPASSCLKAAAPAQTTNSLRFQVKPQVSAPGRTRTLATMLRSYPHPSAVATWQNA